MVSIAKIKLTLESKIQSLLPDFSFKQSLAIVPMKLTAKHSRKTKVHNTEDRYLSKIEDEERTDTDDEVLKWVAHTVYKAKENATLDQKVVQILELSALGVTGVAIDQLRTLV